MSIDLNWETVTGGPDGLELAHQIRDFIHARFQTVPLPRFIKSVTVHDFEFGSIPPELELKDITDPLPDFYAENPDIDDADSNQDSSSEEERTGGGSGSNSGGQDELRPASDRDRDRDRRRGETGNGGGTDTGLMNRGDRPSAHHPRPYLNLGSSKDRGDRRSKSPTKLNDAGSPFLRVSTPGIPGGTSNLSYFHSHFGTALSGSQTPLAAMAGAHHLGNSWLEAHHGHSTSAPNLRQQYSRALESGGGGGDGFQLGHNRNRNMSQSSSILDFNQPPNLSGGGAGLAPGVHSPSSPASPSVPPAGLGISGPSIPHPLREKHSVSTLAPTSVGTSRPPTRDAMAALGEQHDAADNSNSNGGNSHNDSEESPQRRFREPRVEDIQAVFRIKYAGDIKLLLTADILLDYPMPSFVGIPVRLSITGLTFDGVGVLAHIRKRVHFCFLSPEDAVAAVGGEENLARGDEGGRSSSGSAKLGGLLQEIRVESEIGQRESGKQSLKNVGKVERFVLEQVRRIFEEELVYPSFWTFLV